MSIRRIRANHAEIEGEYIKIIDYSMKPIGFIVGAVCGGLLYLAFGLQLTDNHWSFFPFIFFILVPASFAAWICPGKVIRTIPKVDLIEIKNYPSQHKATVVLDDERTKRRQPVAVQKKG